MGSAGNNLRDAEHVLLQVGLVQALAGSTGLVFGEERPAAVDELLDGIVRLLHRNGVVHVPLDGLGEAFGRADDREAAHDLRLQDGAGTGVGDEIGFRKKTVQKRVHGFSASSFVR